jgi:2-polyprenyl-3-methyl-5-hydroxy-6-metoxy-1,4-benzoquinol methylase
MSELLDAPKPPRAGFWNRKARSYAAQPIADEAAYSKKLETTRSYLRPDMQLLELGCGTGTTALIHAPHVKSILAIDFSTRMIEIARAKAEAAGVSNVTFKVTSIEALTGGEARYDAILAMSILHLLDDKQAVLEKVHGMLEPGGLFFSSTTCIGDMAPIKWILPVMTLAGVAPPVQRFRGEDLLASIRDAGFAIEHHWRPGPKEAIFIVARKM